jgi:hypothetical protein
MRAGMTLLRLLFSRTGAIAVAAVLAAGLLAGAGTAQAGLTGGDWTTQTLPADFFIGGGGPPLSPVSCVAGTKFCLVIANDSANLVSGSVIGQAPLVTTDGGQNWKGFATLPSTMELTAVSCSSTSACWGVGQGEGGRPEVAQSTDGGQTWADVTPAAWAGARWHSNGIDCVSATTCWLVGTDTGLTEPAVAQTTDGGASWTLFSNIPTTISSDPNGAFGLNSISCTTALDCVAVGGDNEAGGIAVVDSTVDGGVTWSASADPALSGLEDLFSVSCLPGSSGLLTCHAAGTALQAGGPVEMTSLDGGTTWSGVETDDDTGWLNSISCADTQHCWAAGSGTSVALVGTDNAGASWSAATSDTTNQDGSVSCASAAFCVATTDNELWTTTDDGGLAPATTRLPGSSPLASGTGSPQLARARKPVTQTLPRVSASTVWARTGRTVIVTGQYRGSQAATTASVTIQAPGEKVSKEKVSIRLNHYYSVAISKAAAGTTTVTFAAGNARKKVVRIHGHAAAAPTISSVSAHAGPAGGGATVTIAGTNFSKVTSVSFGSARGTKVKVSSPRRLTVRAPAGKGARYLTVVTAKGGPSPLTGRSVYNYLQVPEITSLSPASGAAGGGTTVTITGTSLAFVQSVYFGGSRATGVRAASAREIRVHSPAGSGTVRVRLVTSGGTTPSVTADRFTY